MTIKHILLPLTGNASNANAAVCGLALAKTLGAHVTAGYENELDTSYLTPGVPGSVADYSVIYEEMEKVRRERRTRARTAFDHAVGATKLPIVSAPICKQGSTMWLDDKYGNDAPISSFGALTDLVVLDAPGSGSSPAAWSAVEQALFNVHRPTLIVPRDTATVDLARVLIAWNGSAEAANAVERALDMLPAEAELTVLQVGELKFGRMSSEKLMDYLGWHCFTAELCREPDRARETGQIILDEARKACAGLIVMGAYTHSRTRELLLGGVTDFMLRQSPLPVLMAH